MANKFPLKIDGLILYDGKYALKKVRNYSQHICDLITSKTFEKFTELGNKIEPNTSEYLYALVDKYPNIPEFKINIVTAHQHMKSDKDFICELLKGVINDHPNFLYAKLSLAKYFLADNKLEEAIKIFNVGEDITLKKLYPKRTKYIKWEYLLFYATLIYIQSLKANRYLAQGEKHKRDAEFIKALNFFRKMVNVDEFNSETIEMSEVLNIKHLHYKTLHYQN